MTEIVRLPPRHRARFVWLLPLWFAIASSAGAFVPGHNGQLFVLGSLAGVWACSLVPVGEDALQWLVPTLIGGVPVLVLLGWFLDRVRAETWLWGTVLVLAAGLAGYVLLQGYGDFEAALEHHGGFTAYLICALQLGSYGATLAVLGLQAFRGADA